MEESNRRAQALVSEAEAQRAERERESAVRQERREQELDSAYHRVQVRFDEIASEGSQWAFLFQLLFVGFFAALFAGVARTLAGWALEALRVWWSG